MITKILLVLALALAALLVVAAFRSDDFHTTRSTTVSASPADVFAQVNDLHRFQQWNPWAKLDPAMKTTYTGPAAGVGAAFEWAGNNQVGAGRMTIVESRPGEFVRIQLDFLKPFPSTSTAEFTFEREGSQTVVTWSMYGKHAYIPRLIGMFVSMDKMIGGAFEQGLADLKAIVEKPAGLAQN